MQNWTIVQASPVPLVTTTSLIDETLTSDRRGDIGAVNSHKGSAAVDDDEVVMGIETHDNYLPITDFKVHFEKKLKEKKAMCSLTHIYIYIMLYFLSFLLSFHKLMADEKKKQELIVNQLAGKHRFKGADEHQEYVKFIDRALSLKKQMDDAIEAKDYKLCDQLDQQAIVKDFPMTFDDFERFKVSPQR
jgi:hypothetical protein